jgi:hypothetical protein
VLKITSERDIPLDQNGMPVLDKPLGEEEIRILCTLSKESGLDESS